MSDGRRPGDSQVTEWAVAAGRGDRRALEHFVRATQPDVWRFLAHLAGVGAADDLTQETYLRALGSLPRFRARSSAWTWLLSIARRVVVDQIRARLIRTQPLPVDGGLGEGERARFAASSGIEQGVVLRALLGSLAEERREALVLTQILGLSYAEAAAVCGCAVGTIRSRVARGREDLLAMWRDTDPGARSRVMG